MSDTNMPASEPAQLWTDERISQWVEDHWQGVGSAEAIAREMRDEYKKRIQQLERQVAELKRMYKDLLALNERNCNDALNIYRLNDALFAMAHLAIADIKAKDERIAALLVQVESRN